MFAFGGRTLFVSTKYPIRRVRLVRPIALSLRDERDLMRFDVTDFEPVPRRVDGLVVSDVRSGDTDASRLVADLGGAEIDAVTVKQHFLFKLRFCWL